MVQSAGIILLVTSCVAFFGGILCINEGLYRRFLIRYMKFFGIDASKMPSSPMIPDPLKSHVVQAKVAGYVFMIFAIVIFLLGVYVLTSL